MAVGREKVRLGEGVGGDALTGGCETTAAEAAIGGGGTTPGRLRDARDDEQEHQERGGRGDAERLAPGRSAHVGSDG